MNDHGAETPPRPPQPPPAPAAAPSPNGPPLITFATDQLRLLFGSGDSLDTRLLGLTGFNITAIALIVSHLDGVGVLGLLPALAFGSSAVSCVLGMWPRRWHVGPHLGTEKIRESLRADPYRTHLGVLRSLADTFDWNLAMVEEKGAALARSLVITLIAAGFAAALYSTSTAHGGPLWKISLSTLKASPAAPATPVVPATSQVVTPAASPSPTTVVSSTSRP